MGFWELLLLAVGLSMDAFAVSICKGLAMDRVTLKKACIPGLWFGGFQGAMPLLGWLLGSRFTSYITSVDHWIAFVLLGILGFNMLREAKNGEAEEADASLGFRVMLAMAVATSIDALAVGITFAFLEVNILPAVSFIALVTFLFSAVGVKIGSLFGTRFKAKAEALGGIILILLGVKILLEHLGVF
ncbi:MAG: manganese efflux pump MntP family protein [Clostridiales bacterium]|uniref:manganese efflux pump MntP n=1 Tax=Evtepia sp. TaxID=2773933 RepID=UPI002982D9FF|nr:manganese efflux pump MntP family protein [Evtepia sp.]MDD7288693.1 manganese efflux pump MntP family protein [Clostridiales bacterium]MDY3992158.1 manganese efflux pump MntP family protein [Evtepia sp.]MDY4430134.1 manganese efflux pump MntP family protein [Evtepia sp.]